MTATNILYGYYIVAFCMITASTLCNSELESLSLTPLLQTTYLDIGCTWGVY